MFIRNSQNQFGLSNSKGAGQPISQRPTTDGVAGKNDHLLLDNYKTLVRDTNLGSKLANKSRIQLHEMKSLASSSANKLSASAS